MTRPRRWTTERVAELRRRHDEDGVTFQALGDEYGVTKQAMQDLLKRTQDKQGKQGKVRFTLWLSERQRAWLKSRDNGNEVLELMIDQAIGEFV